MKTIHDEADVLEYTIKVLHAEIAKLKTAKPPSIPAGASPITRALRRHLNAPMDGRPTINPLFFEEPTTKEG